MWRAHMAHVADLHDDFKEYLIIFAYICCASPSFLFDL